MTKLRPRVFIGSSGEGLKIAEAIQVNLDRAAEVKIWSQGVFGLSDGTLEGLVKALPNYDFAVLVLTPDDLVESRGSTSPAPRDNVLFELGLFIGRLGRERCFIVHERDKPLKLPSDLAGITPADFQVHGDGNLIASLGSASTRIRDLLENLGRIDSNHAASISGAVGSQVLADLLEIPALQFFILMHENGSALNSNGPFGFGPRYEYDQPKKSRGSGVFHVSGFCSKLADAGLLQADLRGNITLTDKGHEFSKWLIAKDKKAAYFWSDHGGWGERPADNKNPHIKDSPRYPFLK